MTPRKRNKTTFHSRVARALKMAKDLTSELEMIEVILAKAFEADPTLKEDQFLSSLADHIKKEAIPTQVVAYYREKHPGRGRGVVAGHKYYKMIEARVSEGFTLEELRLAIDGNLKDEWHKGNPAGHGLEYIFRNSAKVEQFIELIKRGPKKTGNHSGSREFSDGEAEF